MMTNTLRGGSSLLAVASLLAIVPGFPVAGQTVKTTGVGEAQNVTAGPFATRVPTDWTAFGSNEATRLRREYMAQSQQIYRQFSGADDSAKSVDVVAFHIAKGAGTFVMVVMTVPPTANLIPLLKSQVNDKIAFGIREGYIRKYLGLVSVDNDRFSGFYTKAIGKSGAIEVSGGLEHKSLRNTIIQLTLT